MRKFLLSAMTVAVSLTANALDIKTEQSLRVHNNAPETTSDNSFKKKYGLGSMRNANITPAISLSAIGQKSADNDEADMVTDPQGQKSRYAMATDIFLSHMGATHVGGFGAEGITSEDGKHFYTKALTLNFFQQGYSEGEIDGDRIVFKSGQYVYNTENNEKAYMYGAVIEEEDGWPVITESFVLTKDEQGRYVSAPDCYMLILTEDQAAEEIDATTEFICFACNYVFTPIPAGTSENKFPADAETFECQFVANSLIEYGDMTMKDITVGVKGDNIYIGGLTDYLPDAYLMGTKTGENTYTFDTRQYLGYYDEGDYPYVYEFATVNPIYFDGESVGFSPAESLTMTFNEDRTMLTMEDYAGIFVCAYGDFNTWDEVYWDIKIGNFDQPQTPSDPSGVNCYGAYGTTYMTFEWSNFSVEGLPMITDRLWCEIIINGKPYEFTPELYEGLDKTTDRIYYSTSEIDGIYVGSFSTIYLYEYDGRFDDIRTIGVRIGYENGGEVRYTDTVYATGFEPFEDNAFTPSTPSELVFYKGYNNNIMFKFDGKDTEGNEIPARLLAAEILLDGKPLVFNNSNYYFDGIEDKEVTIVGLSEYSINYSYSLVNDYGGEYVLSLWGHDELPEFKEIAVRIVCTGGNTLTYGESCELQLERAATPADPWDVEYDKEYKKLTFGALPIDTKGNGLAPWNYGYEIYVNDNLYVFKGDLYDLEENITVIPYEGFEYNYNFYLSSQTIYDESDWSAIGTKVTMEVDMSHGDPQINKIGVRAVYTDAEGIKTYSNIVNSDGTINGDVSGIQSAIENNHTEKWYNLQGVEVSKPAPGSTYIRKQGDKTTKIFVK
ncbi:MAG: hypothetical protein K2K32_01735 [Muribaculaceae bacterium]|nr:hypothetical protein [Muribaculaceae bacterium]